MVDSVECVVQIVLIVFYSRLYIFRILPVHYYVRSFFLLDSSEGARTGLFRITPNPPTFILSCWLLEEWVNGRVNVFHTFKWINENFTAIKILPLKINYKPAAWRGYMMWSRGITEVNCVLQHRQIQWKIHLASEIVKSVKRQRLKKNENFSGSCQPTHNIRMVEKKSVWKLNIYENDNNARAVCWMSMGIIFFPRYPKQQSSMSMNNTPANKN